MTAETTATPARDKAHGVAAMGFDVASDLSGPETFLQQMTDLAVGHR